MRVPVVAAALVLSLSPALGQSAPSSDAAAARIQAVENGLVGAVVIKGEPRPTRSIAAEMQRLHVPGVSVAVMQHGRLSWARGYGLQQPNGAPVTAETLFQAASISKSITSMATLKLVQQGSLSLDAPVSTEVKSWHLPPGKQSPEHPVTLRELLSHTAGTNVHGFPGYSSTEPVPTLVEVLNGTKPANTPAIQVVDVPGTAFSYSGGGYTIVQQILIDSTGKPFPGLLQSLVLGPAGMTHSSFQQPLSAARLHGAAFPADGEGKPIPGGPHVYPELAAAGLWTTPSDLVLWMGNLLRSSNGEAGGVLSPASARLMLTPVKESYGLGITTRVPGSDQPALFSHTGGNAGYGDIYVCLPNGDGAVIMTSGDNGFELYVEILRSIAAAYGWPGFAPVERTALPLDAKALQPYLGQFKGAHGPVFSLSLHGDRLTFDQGDRQQVLRESAPGTFFMTDGPTDVQLHFTSPDKGEVIFPQGTDTFSRQPAATPQP